MKKKVKKEMYISNTDWPGVGGCVDTMDLTRVFSGGDPAAEKGRNKTREVEREVRTRLDNCRVELAHREDVEREKERKKKVGNFLFSSFFSLFSSWTRPSALTLPARSMIKKRLP